MNIKKLAIVMGVVSLTNLSAARADINVVTSIKPVHSLVSGVMSGVGTPSLIVDGAGSPHTYSLKSSQARLLQDAKLVFWMGDELEAFLETPIANIANSAKTIKLIDTHDLKRIKFRDGGMFDDHDHEKHAKKDHDDHGHGEFDPHVWLDPINAKALIHAIEEALIKADPENASTYEANAHKMIDKLNALVVELSHELEPVHKKGFIVFHDAYQYFEQRFGVAAVGSITSSPEVMPGAERVSKYARRYQN